VLEKLIDAEQRGAAPLTADSRLTTVA